MTTLKQRNIDLKQTATEMDSTRPETAKQEQGSMVSRVPCATTLPTTTNGVVHPKTVNNDKFGKSQTPLLKVGVLSDIQYADIDNKKSYVGRDRFYRNSLCVLERAVGEWRGGAVDCVLHCGDIIDCVNLGLGASDSAIAAVLKRLENLDVPVYHALGNHCAGCFNRDQLRSLLKLPTKSGDVGYYSFIPHPKWRFVVLDACDVSPYGWPEDHPHYKKAHQILAMNNPNENKFSHDGLEGPNKRFILVNGAVGSEQLLWLERELCEASTLEQNIAIACHIPLIPGLYRPSCLVWNYEEVLGLLHKFPNVKLAMYGHTHQRNYLQDQTGLHHVVFPGVVETAVGGEGHACLEFYDDRIELNGFDMPASLVMEFGQK